MHSAIDSFQPQSNSQQSAAEPSCWLLHTSGINRPPSNAISANLLLTFPRLLEHFKFSTVLSGNYLLTFLCCTVTLSTWKSLTDDFKDIILFLPALKCNLKTFSSLTRMHTTFGSLLLLCFVCFLCECTCSLTRANLYVLFDSIFVKSLGDSTGLISCCLLNSAHNNN